MIYSYRCKACDYRFDRSLRMDNRKDPESEPCPDCNMVGDVYQSITSAPTIGDAHRMGHIKPAAGFNEVLRTIKKGNPGSSIEVRD